MQNGVKAIDTLQKSFIQKSLNKNSRSYNIFIIALLIILLVFGILLSIAIGSSKIPLSEVVSVLFGRSSTSKEYQIINYVRIPRTFAAILAGCALSLAGLILQSVLKQLYCWPKYYWVNSGAGLFTTLIMALLPAYFELIPLAAFAGALITSLLVYYIAKRTGASRLTIVLSGVAVSSFMGAITDTVLTLWPDTAISRTSFLIGGLSGVTMDKLKFPGILIFIAFALAFIFSYDLNILTLEMKLPSP